MPRLAATSESVVRRPSIGLLERAIAGSTGTTLAGSARKGATSAAKTSRSAWLAGRAPSISRRQTSSSGRRSASSIAECWR